MWAYPQSRMPVRVATHSSECELRNVGAQHALCTAADLARITQHAQYTMSQWHAVTQGKVLILIEYDCCPETQCQAMQAAVRWACLNWMRSMACAPNHANLQPHALLCTVLLSVQACLKSCPERLAVLRPCHPVLL